MRKRYQWDKELKKLIEISKRDPGPKVYIIPDIQPYLDENISHDPIWIKSRRHRTEILRERKLAIK